MSSKETKKVVEDSPEMRSVAILSSAPVLSTAVPLSKVGMSQLLVVEKTTQNPVSSSETWSVGTLKPIPMFYMLERTSTRVADAQPDQVAARISEALRADSIAATFHKEEALVEAETACGLRFNVRLWEDKGKVVVELQRRDGCCFLFNQCVKKILRASKGMAAPARRINFTVPECVPRETPESERKCLEEGLHMANTLLKENRVDAHMLAVESLVQISKVTQEKEFAAHCILCGEFQSTLLSLIESFHLDRETYEEVNTKIEKDALRQMHRQALTILANCLSALEQSGELAHVLETQKDLCSEKLLSALINDAQSACEKPHDACQAIRCIGSIGMTSSLAKERLIELGAPSVVAKASKQGVCSHAKLARECERLRSFAGM